MRNTLSSYMYRWVNCILGYMRLITYTLFVLPNDERAASLPANAEEVDMSIWSAESLQAIRGVSAILTLNMHKTFDMYRV